MEKLGYGLLMMGLGMLIVFIGLVILIVAITLMGRLLKRFAGADAPVRVEPALATASAVASLPMAASAKVLEANAGGELALVAGLTALALAAGDAGKQFVVRAIRRVER